MAILVIIVDDVFAQCMGGIYLGKDCSWIEKSPLAK